MTIEELKSNIKWWESKRWIFNLVVGIAIIIAIYDGLSREEYQWTTDDLFLIICWFIRANILYTLGILLELFDWYYLNNRIGIKRFRILFFIIGILLSFIGTLWKSWCFFLEPHLW